MPRHIFLLLTLIFSATLTAQVFTDSNLPIISINTNSQPIYDDPKTPASLTVYYNTNGSRNYLTNPPQQTGNIGIELRGSSSSTMGKPGYGFETWDPAGNEIDTTLLNMPAGSDWILYASANDKTFLRNVLTYDIYNRMGNYAVRTQHCELLINGQYQGLYVLMEKIKRGSNRVDIAKLRAQDTTGLELTGGYIIKSDKTTGSGGGYFPSNFPNNIGQFGGFQYEYPSDVNIQPQQMNYIYQYVDSFQAALFGPNFTDPVLGYRNFANAYSFIDYMIINELSKNPDTYVLSTYIVKPKDDDGRKLEMGPPWDYDLAWKNSFYLGADTLGGWVYNQPIGRIAWWQMMIQDQWFADELRCRWAFLRQNQLSVNRIHQYIDSMALYLNEAQQRNFALWPVLGQNVYYNSFPYPPTFQAEIDTLKSWVTRRMAWLDVNWPGACASIGMQEIAAGKGLMVWPNPFTEQVTLRLAGMQAGILSAQLSDLSGRVVQVFAQVPMQPGENEVMLKPAPDLPSGVYLLVVNTPEGQFIQKLVRE